MKKRSNKQSAAEDLLLLIIVCMFIGVGVYLAPLIIILVALLFIFSACKVAGDCDGDDDEEKKQ